MEQLLSTDFTDWLVGARQLLEQRQVTNTFPTHTVEYATLLGKQVCEVLESHGGINDFHKFQALEQLPYDEFKATLARAQSLVDLILMEMLAAVGNPEDLMHPVVLRVVGESFNHASVPARIELKSLWSSNSRKRYLARYCAGVGKLRYHSGANSYRLQINKAYLMTLEWALRDIQKPSGATI
jgi:hypothetical protein